MTSAMETYRVPPKLDLTPRRWHAYIILIFILGALLPPLAVAARFGIGKDFWINVLLTLCGYIPGHGHNFYIQNIRNNKTHARTPKWVQRYRLVDMAGLERKQRKSQWANQYKGRNPVSSLEGQPYEAGQNSGPSQEEGTHAMPPQTDQLWTSQDEQYYTAPGEAQTTPPSGRWHYPANFDDVIVDDQPPASKASAAKKKHKKNRWERTEDAYSQASTDTGKKKKKKQSKVGGKKSRKRAESSASDAGGDSEFPEDSVGGLYGERAIPSQETRANGQITQVEDVLDHQL